MLKKNSVYIIDDTETFGKGVADAFEKDFKARGGTVVKHDGAPKTTQDYVVDHDRRQGAQPRVDLLRWRHRHRRRADPPGRPAGRPRRHPVRRPGRHQRRLRRDQGLVPEPGRRPPPRTRTARWPVSAPSPARTSSTPTTRRSTASTRPATPARATPAPRSSSTRSKRAARDQPGRHDRPSARRSASPAPTPLRQYTTILGDITFDANGDTSQKIVSIYSFDPAGANAR